MSFIKRIQAAIGVGPLDEHPANQLTAAILPGDQGLNRETNTEKIGIDTGKQVVPDVSVETGTTTIEVVQAIWGRRGRLLVIIG